MQISDLLRNSFKRPSEYFHNHPTLFRVTQIAAALLGCAGALASRVPRFYEDDPRFLITIGTLGTFSGALIPLLIKASNPAPDSEDFPYSTVAEPPSERSFSSESSDSSDFENLDTTPPITPLVPPSVEEHSPRQLFPIFSYHPQGQLQ